MATSKTSILGVTLAAGLLLSPALADSFKVTGVVRDFKRGDQSDGHPDFQTVIARGLDGHAPGMVTMSLSEDRKPVYNPDRPALDSMYSQTHFDQWYRDVSDVNLSQPLTLTLDNGQTRPGGVYTYSNVNFFPIDDALFGNQGLEHNYHFTFEMHGEFTYEPGQTFRFVGDDDVWVYLNGTRVIDLGGVHQALSGEFLLFDGKAFVEAGHFPLSETVRDVDNALANKLSENWQNLHLPGECPVQPGAHYVDLYLTEGATDTRAVFNGTSVDVYSAKDLSNVVLKFEDGTEQKFDNLVTGPSATFSGTDENEDKPVAGVWVKSGNNKSGDGPGKGHYHDATGGTNIEATLDFFFAERHTTESAFQIETTIPIKSVPIDLTSPTYD
ncbi:MAG: fibro-slime domain-containing protein [Phycisphaeraceae bacterium]